MHEFGHDVRAQPMPPAASPVDRQLGFADRRPYPDRLREGVMSPDVVWPLINLELWFRIFVDREPYWVEQVAALATSRLLPSSDIPVRS